MGQIHIEGMEFYAYHGHYSEEKVVGNHFLVDLKMYTDMSVAAEKDNLEDAVDYQKAYKIVEREMAITSNLLENVAGRISKSIISELHSVDMVSVKVTKLNPALGGKIKGVSVRMACKREE